MQDSPRIPNASPFRIHTPVLNSPVFESTTYEAEEEQAFVCEGPLADFPIMDDRTSGLAVECWNLRKTILDLNSKSIQLQRDLKTHKNLVRSQKKLVNDVTEENRTRLRESTSLKIKISELEKKLQESNKANDALSTNVERYKKVISNMTTKHNAADREKKEQLAHR
ncbi:hypothetical protein EON64_12565 [archaeon]|nr:MAG: hypothetical protein EON64_12565 [archaeon]